MIKKIIIGVAFLFSGAAMAFEMPENLTQGMFVGSVSDNFNERIEQKIFHAEIVVDSAKVDAEMKHYEPIPIIADFTDADGNDIMEQTIRDNYNRIKDEVKQIVSDELERIKNDPTLQHLLQQKG